MLFTLASAYLVFLVALMSPGPDFAVTVQNSVRHGWRAGVLTAVGIVCGNLVHIAYVNVGLGAVIAHSVVAFNVMKFAAAGYLCYIGWKGLRSKRYNIEEIEATPGIGDGHAFRSGAVTAMLNPKAAMFWLSYFTVVLTPGMPLALLAGFVALLIFSAGLWFSLVAWGLSRAAVRKKFLRLGHWFDRAAGAVLIAMGIKVALARQ